MENDIRLETRALRSSVSQGRSVHFLLFFPDPRRDQVQLTRRIPLAFMRPLELSNKSDPDIPIHVDPDSEMDRTRRMSTPA
jgi:hypothetical protein